MVLVLHSDADTTAAALAAVYCYIAQEQPADQPARARPAWQVAAAQAAQGQPAARNGSHATWGAVERCGRAGRWSSGIVGL